MCEALSKQPKMEPEAEPEPQQSHGFRQGTAVSAHLYKMLLSHPGARTGLSDLAAASPAIRTTRDKQL
jgi:hypothetical protein